MALKRVRMDNEKEGVCGFLPPSNPALPSVVRAAWLGQHWEDETLRG